jgi:hypothetical protein
MVAIRLVILEASGLPLVVVVSALARFLLWAHRWTFVWLIKA